LTIGENAKMLFGLLKQSGILPMPYHHTLAVTC